MKCENCKPGEQAATQTMAMPPVATTAEWQEARDRLLIKEKAATHAFDALAAERRRLPMVPLEKSYIFEGAKGKVSLEHLFEGRRQLIVYHFMYGPDWESPCPGCSRRIDDVGHLAHLHARQTTFVAVARAAYPTLVALRKRKRWTLPFYSSGQSDFNSDMGVTVTTTRTSASASSSGTMRTPSIEPTSPAAAAWNRPASGLCST